MNIKKLTESIGLSAKELRPFLIDELQEFLEANDPEDQINEFHDIIFALKNIAYAHTGKHIDIKEEIYENKIEDRLKNYGTISKKNPFFSHTCISQVPIGVVHISFGNFKSPWTQFDPFKNGTEAEIAMLTDNEFKENQRYTNHIIITFDNVDKLEFGFLTSSWNEFEKNTLICKIPDFIYSKAKNKKNFDEIENLLSLQTYSALKRLNLLDDCIFHFHSWESALCLGSPEIKGIIGKKKKIFSPYLTVARLKKFLEDQNKFETTLNKEELIFSSKYELDVAKYCDLVVVESESDFLFYSKQFGSKVKKYSYSELNEFIVETNGVPNGKLEFVSGGRPVFEKGFLELLKEIPGIVEFAKLEGLEFKLKIFCKEYDRKTKEMKKQNYMKEIEKLIEKLKIKKYVSICDKVSINKLRKEIEKSCGLVVPSLYDPYCLMPHYAIDVKKISFVSIYTGISENIISQSYLFDPLKKGDLLRAIKKWFRNKENFIIKNENKSYKLLYKN